MNWINTAWYKQHLIEILSHCDTDDEKRTILQRERDIFLDCLRVCTEVETEQNLYKPYQWPEGPDVIWTMGDSTSGVRESCSGGVPFGIIPQTPKK
jgi:hypothetical protein